MTKFKKQAELNRLINGELLEVITKIAELSIGSFPDENCERHFTKQLTKVIEMQIVTARELVKLSKGLCLQIQKQTQDNEFEDKKTLQDVRVQEEQKEKCVNCEISRKQLIYSDESKFLAEIILHRMTDKGLPLSVLEEAVILVEKKFKGSAILTI